MPEESIQSAGEAPVVSLGQGEFRRDWPAAKMGPPGQSAARRLLSEMGQTHEWLRLHVAGLNTPRARAWNGIVARSADLLGYAAVAIQNEERVTGDAPAAPAPVEPYRVAEKMEMEGGSFVAKLGQAWMVADNENRRRIETTWPEYWAEYAERVRAFDRRHAGSSAGKAGA